MKTFNIITAAGMAALVGMLCAPAQVRAGEVVISNFDDAVNDATLWSWENWSDPATVDGSTLDATGVTGSGSMKVTCNFPDRPTGYSQAVVTTVISPTVDAETLYSSIGLDIKLDPASYPRVNGTNYGQLDVILRNGANWDWNTVGSIELNASHTNWTHLSYPVKTPADSINHLTLKLGQNNLTNTVIYYVDNIRWTELTNAVPPPKMAIEKTVPGLNLLSASAGQYDRQNIATVATTFGWIGSSAPMSYSMTIKSFPDGASYPGFTTHFYLVPGTPGTEDAPDWNEGSCILVDIGAGTNNTGTMTFHYKTNAPNSNGINNQFFNTAASGNTPVGQLGSVTGAKIIGTWTVSLDHDTNITLIASDGTTTTLAMPPEDAAQFAGEITAYFGMMPGQTANIGQRAIVSHAQIKSGTTTLVDDNFTAPLDSNVWIVRAASAAGVALITPSEPYYVYWTTPASGFVLQTNATVSYAGWGDAGVTDQLVGLRRRALIPASALPAPGQGLFRLNKPAQ